MTAGSASIEIDRTTAEVYAVISAVERTGEWSPECVRTEWLDGATGPAVGARFVGTNRQGSREWTMEAVVDEATPGEAFAFHTVRDGDVRTRWGYRLAPNGDGTTLTEWYERVAKPPLVVRLLERLVVGDRQKRNDDNIRKSLAAIKAICEAG